MNNSAGVRSIQALEDLQAVLARFGGDGPEVLNAVALEIRRTLEWLDERYRYWHAEVCRWQDGLDEAKVRLAACHDDEDSDCTEEEETVYRTRRRLQEAEDELQTVRTEGRRVQQAVVDYQRQARRLAALLADDLPKAKALLKRKIEILHAYVTAGMPSVTSSGASHVSATSISVAATGREALMTVAQEKPEIRDIPLEQIDLSGSSIEDAGDYKKVNRSEMVEGVFKLEEVVRSAVQKGADGDYFSAWDTEQGLDYEQGYRRIYDAFYGNDPIILERVGESYQVINGYHRLLVAKELGIKTLPALVLESKP